jgi:hypothetical protein
MLGLVLLRGGGGGRAGGGFEMVAEGVDCWVGAVGEGL